jgi:RND family efflux transporter MFP subunit
VTATPLKPRAYPAVACLLLLASLGACAQGGAGTGSTADSTAAEAVPVQAARIRLDTLQVTVSAPGRTQVLHEETVRAPFAGTLTRLDVIDGDRIAANQPLGALVSQGSEAALTGAQAMLASARTARDSADAREALDLARRDRVERTLRASEAGVVLSHAASPGDRVGEGDEILRLAAAGSAVFLAEVSQNDLSRVRPGQTARVMLPARADTLAGTVHGVMPSASSSSFSAPVRIDFRNGLPVPAVGLFGTAVIVVGEHRGVLSVPTEAVLTDDVTGVSRVAVIRHGHAIWIRVETGVRNHGRVEVAGPGLAAGEPVIVNGQVGLPDSSAVRIER